jgi:2-polyprenyl-3-methyl-5-hydroxy-6-metoxy-1,4-benzoquinol methylase
MTPLNTRPFPKDPVFCREGKLKHRCLSDRLYSVPGQWNLRGHRDLLWLDPMPLPESIMHAYASYHTHDDDLPAADHASNRVGWYHQLRERVWEALSQGDKQKSRMPWAASLPLVREQLRFDRAFLAPRPSGARLLDVGCGCGELAARLSRLGWDARGIDPDPHAVDQAQSMGRPVALAGVESLADMTDTFDAITLFHVIEHVFEPMKVLRNLARLLNPGGQLVVVTPNAGSLCSRFFGRHWRGLEPPRHLQLFTRRSLDEALGEVGFKNRTIKTSPRDASGMFCASYALWRSDKHTQGSTPKRHVRLLGDVTLASEWLLTNAGLSLGEELVMIAEKTS